jgi:hypothetical protein
MEYSNPRQILINAFCRIKLDEKTHTYFVDDEKYPSSTTTIVSEFGDKFDEDKMSKIIAEKEGVEQQEILERWALNREEACSRGSFVHKCMEYVPMQSEEEAFKILKDNLTKSEFIKLFNDKELEQVLAGIDWYNNLIKKHGDRYVILMLELKMFMPQFKHCGTADIILWDNYTNTIIIADWKTNKDLFKTEYYKTRKFKYLNHPFSHLLDCPYSKYILQFSHYQMMLEKGTNLTVSDRWLIWLTNDNIVSGYSDRGNGWVQYNTPDYSKTLYQHYSQKISSRPKSLLELCKKNSTI